MITFVAAVYAVARLCSAIYPFEAKSTENLCDFSFRYLCLFSRILGKVGFNCSCVIQTNLVNGSAMQPIHVWLNDR